MALGPQPAGDFEPVHAGQAEIEDDQVDTTLKARVESGGSVLADLDLVPLPAKGAGQGF
ncbi:hypothetical protein GCM10023082_22010 [Streptomyces tremellae]|uniref:Uncharacterized protein n=1 Tax=Streptomyces tremellae TaxID=1124239 RepID=A0ABP7ERQ3_9ACTN